MYFSVRVGRHSRIGGGPLFWLIAGPIILEFYILLISIKLVIWLFASGANSIRGHRQIAAPKPPKRQAALTPTPPAQPEDAVPPGYMARRPRG